MNDQFMKAILNVLVTADRLSHSTNTVLKPFGISKEQFNVLRILRGQKGIPVSLHLITERMISRTSNATRLVEKLRLKELIERTQCSTDRRQIDIVITQAGLELLKELDPLMKQNGENMRNLTEPESEQLNLLLDKMRG